MRPLTPPPIQSPTHHATPDLYSHRPVNSERFSREFERLENSPSPSKPTSVSNSYLAELIRRDGAASHNAIKWLETEGNQYTNLFSSLGLNSDQINQVVDKLADSYKLSMMLEQSVMDLLKSRSAYTNTLHELLGDESHYNDYISFEANRHSISELTKLKSFATEKGLALDSNLDAALQEAMRDAQAYTRIELHGPLDPMPTPGLGIDAVRKWSVDEMGRVELAVNALFDKLGALDENQKQLIASYYQETIQQLSGNLEMFKGTEAEVLERVRHAVDGVPRPRVPGQ